MSEIVNKSENYTIDPSTSTPDSRLSTFVKGCRQLTQIYSVKPLEYTDIVGEYWQRINDLIFTLGLTKTQEIPTNIGWTVPILGKQRSDLVTEELGTLITETNGSVTEISNNANTERDINGVAGYGTGKAKAHKYGLVQSIDRLFGRLIDTIGEDFYNWLDNAKECIFSYDEDGVSTGPNSLEELLFNSWDEEGSVTPPNPSWCEYFKGLHSKGLLVETYNIVKYLGDDYDNYVNHVNYIKNPNDDDNPANPLNPNYIEYDEERNPLFVLKKIDIGQVLYGNKKTDINGNQYTIYENDYIDKNVIICETTNEVEYVKNYFANQENIFNKFIKLSYHNTTDNPITNENVYPKVTQSDEIGKINVKLAPTTNVINTFDINVDKNEYKKYKNNKFTPEYYGIYPSFEKQSDYVEFTDERNTNDLTINNNFGPLYTLYSRSSNLFNTRSHKIIGTSEREITSGESTSKKYYYKLDETNFVVPINFENFNITVKNGNNNIYTVDDKKVNGYVLEHLNDDYFIDKSVTHSITVVENKLAYYNTNNINVIGDIVEGIYVDSISYPITNNQVTIDGKVCSVSGTSRSISIGSNNYSIINNGNEDIISESLISYNNKNYIPVLESSVSTDETFTENTALYSVGEDTVNIQYITSKKYIIENAPVYQLNNSYTKVRVQDITTGNGIQKDNLIYPTETDIKWVKNQNYTVLYNDEIYTIEVSESLSNDYEKIVTKVSFEDNENIVYANKLSSNDNYFLSSNHKLYFNNNAGSNDYGIIIDNSAEKVKEHVTTSIDNETKELTTYTKNAIFNLNPNEIYASIVNADGEGYVHDYVNIRISDIPTNFIIINNANYYITNTIEVGNHFTTNEIEYTILLDENNKLIASDGENDYQIYNLYDSAKEYAIIDDVEELVSGNYTIDENDATKANIVIDDTIKQINIYDIYKKIINYKSPNTNVTSETGYILQSEIDDEIKVSLDETFNVYAYYYITDTIKYVNFKNDYYANVNTIEYTAQILDDEQQYIIDSNNNIYDIYSENDSTYFEVINNDENSTTTRYIITFDENDIPASVSDGENTYSFDEYNSFTAIVPEDINYEIDILNETVSDGKNTYQIENGNQFTIGTAPNEITYTLNLQNGTGTATDSNNNEYEITSNRFTVPVDFSITYTLYKNAHTVYDENNDATISVFSTLSTDTSKIENISNENSFAIIDNKKYPVSSIYTKYYVVTKNGTTETITLNGVSYVVLTSYEYNNTIYSPNANNEITINDVNYTVSKFNSNSSLSYINYNNINYIIENNKVYITNAGTDISEEAYYELKIVNDTDISYVYYNTTPSASEGKIKVIIPEEEIINELYIEYNNTRYYAVNENNNSVITIDNIPYIIEEYTYTKIEKYLVEYNNIVIVSNVVYIQDSNASTFTINDVSYPIISNESGDAIYITTSSSTIAYNIIHSGASLLYDGITYNFNPSTNKVTINDIIYTYGLTNIIKTVEKVIEVTKTSSGTNVIIDGYTWDGNSTVIHILDNDILIRNYLKVAISENEINYYQLNYNNSTKKYYITISNNEVILYNVGYEDDNETLYVIKENNDNILFIKGQESIVITQTDDGYEYVIEDKEHFIPYDITYNNDSILLEKYIIYENEYYKIENNIVKINNITYTLDSTNSIDIEGNLYHFVYAVCITDNSKYKGTFSTVSLYNNGNEFTSFTLNACTYKKTCTVSNENKTVIILESPTGDRYNSYVLVFPEVLTKTVNANTINWNSNESTATYSSSGTFTLTTTTEKRPTIYCYIWDFIYRTTIFVNSNNFTHFNYWYYAVSNTNYIVPSIITKNKLFVTNITKHDLSELVAWEFLDDAVKCGSNTNTSVCLVSDKKYNEFYYSVTPSSDTDDDDLLGAVISSFTETSTGLTHSLSLVKVNNGFCLVYDHFRTNCDYQTYIPYESQSLKTKMLNGQYCGGVCDNASGYYKSYNTDYDIPNKSQTFYKLIYHTTGPTSRGVTSPAFNGGVDVDGTNLKTNWQSVPKSLRKLLSLITPDSNNNFNVVLRASNCTPDATLLDNADTGNVNSSNYVLYPYHTDMNANTYYDNLSDKHKNIIIVTMKALFNDVTTNDAAVAKFKNVVYPKYKLSTFDFDKLTNDDLYKLYYGCGITRVFDKQNKQIFTCDIYGYGWVNCIHKNNNVITVNRKKVSDNSEYYKLVVTYKDILFDDTKDKPINITIYYDENDKYVKYEITQGEEQSYTYSYTGKLLQDTNDAMYANSLITMMKTQTSYGFFANSNPLTYYTDITFVDKTNGKMYDLESNKTYVVDPITQQYVLDNTSSNSVTQELFNTFGAGRLLTNTLTGKTFYASKEYDAMIKIVDPINVKGKDSGLIIKNGSIAINPNTDHGLYINENNQLDCTFISDNNEDGGGITFSSSLTLISKELGSYVNKMPNVFSIYGSNPNYELALISDPYEIVKNTGGSGAQLYLHGSTAYRVHNVNGTYATGENALPGQFGIHATGYAPIRNNDGTLPAYNASNSEDAYIDKTKLLSKIFRGDPEGNLVWGGSALQIVSDERKKANIGNIPDAILDAWNDINWIQFNYKEQLGSPNMKLHTGLIAQSINMTFEKYGLKATDYGLVTFDEISNFWNVRYEEALAMEAAYQRRRADELEKRIERLEKLLKV